MSKRDPNRRPKDGSVRPFDGTSLSCLCPLPLTCLLDLLFVLLVETFDIRPFPEAPFLNSDVT